jgi:hypothetical protein
MASRKAAVWKKDEGRRMEEEEDGRLLEGRIAVYQIGRLLLYIIHDGIYEEKGTYKY